MKVALINGICVKHDAISNAIVAEYHHLEGVFGRAAVKFYGYALDYPQLSHLIVRGPTDILRDAFFRNADLIIYHFGVRYELFSLLLIGNGRAKQLVCYHNITPLTLVSADQHEVITTSLRQQENLRFADHVYCDSEFNRNCLRSTGIPACKLSVVGLPCVDPRSYSELSGYAGGDVLRCICVGRVVPSKGVKDLLLALKACLDQGRGNFSLRLVGNASFSDRGYIDDLKGLLGSDPRLAQRVAFLGEVDEVEKQSLLRSSDLLVVPSYHEGFCVPVVEAHASGCYVIAYDNSNLPNVVGQFGQLVRTGDTISLASVVSDLCDEWRRASDVRGKTAPLAPLGETQVPFDRYRVQARDFANRNSILAHRARFLQLVNCMVTQ